jgi:hypothetical protein
MQNSGNLLHLLRFHCESRVRDDRQRDNGASSGEMKRDGTQRNNTEVLTRSHDSDGDDAGDSEMATRAVRRPAKNGSLAITPRSFRKEDWRGGRWC